MRTFVIGGRDFIATTLYDAVEGLTVKRVYGRGWSVTKTCGGGLSSGMTFTWTRSGKWSELVGSAEEGIFTEREIDGAVERAAESKKPWWTGTNWRTE